MSSYQTGTIRANHRWNTTLYSLRIALQSPLQFTPGQYTKIAAQIDGELIARPYSIASSPHSDVLEFFIVEIDDGPLSPLLYNIKAGDSLLIENQANGFLTLVETPQVADMWLLATGTGIAPFLSMLREGSIFARHQKVVLAQSVRHNQDLAYAEELAALAQRQPGFRYIQLVSRDCMPVRETPKPGNVLRLGGRITTALADGSLEKAAGTRLAKQQSHLMLCGNPQMIEETLKLLQGLGMQRHRRRRAGQITLEKFW